MYTKESITIQFQDLYYYWIHTFTINCFVITFLNSFNHYLLFVYLLIIQLIVIQFIIKFYSLWIRYFSYLLYYLRT